MRMIKPDLKLPGPVVKFFLALMAFLASSISNAETSSCIQLTNVDYSRSCGDVTNFNNLQRLKVGECATLAVNSKSRWNASNLLLEAGAEYQFTESDASDNCWKDASILVRGDGWTNGGKHYSKCGLPEKDSNIKGSVFIAWPEWLRRYPDADWFTLIGVASKGGLGTNSEQFIIGQGPKTYEPNHNAEFCSYANDLNFMHWNNKRSLLIEIMRTK